MARLSGFDASYISRICSGKRKPSNIDAFTDSICRYVVKTYFDEDNKKIVSNLINVPLNEMNNNENYFAKLKNWFFTNTNPLPNPVNRFLEKLDEFDLNEYIKTIHFDTLKVPTSPFSLPNSKNYNVPILTSQKNTF